MFLQRAVTCFLANPSNIYYLSECYFFYCFFCPCPLPGGFTRWPLKASSNPNGSMIQFNQFGGCPSEWLHFPKPQLSRGTMRIMGSLLIYAYIMNMVMLTGWELCILTFGNIPIKKPETYCKSTVRPSKALPLCALPWGDTLGVYITSESAHKAWTNSIFSVSPSAWLSGCEMEGSSPAALREHWEGWWVLQPRPHGRVKFGFIFPDATRWRLRISDDGRRPFGNWLRL